MQPFCNCDCHKMEVDKSNVVPNATLTIYCPDCYSYVDEEHIYLPYSLEKQYTCFQCEKVFIYTVPSKLY